MNEKILRMAGKGRLDGESQMDVLQIAFLNVISIKNSLLAIALAHLVAGEGLYSAIWLLAAPGFMQESGLVGIDFVQQSVGFSQAC